MGLQPPGLMGVDIHKNPATRDLFLKLLRKGDLDNREGEYEARADQDLLVGIIQLWNISAALECICRMDVGPVFFGKMCFFVLSYMYYNINFHFKKHGFYHVPFHDE